VSSHRARILDAYGLMAFMLKVGLPVQVGQIWLFGPRLSTRLTKPNSQGDGGPQEPTLLVPEIGGAHRLDV